MISVFTLHVVDGAVQVIRGVINPDKLHHLGAVADAWALAREASVTDDRTGGTE